MKTTMFLRAIAAAGGGQHVGHKFRPRADYSVAGLPRRTSFIAFGGRPSSSVYRVRVEESAGPVNRWEFTLHCDDFSDELAAWIARETHRDCPVQIVIGRWTNPRKFYWTKAASSGTQYAGIYGHNPLSPSEMPDQNTKG